MAPLSRGDWMARGTHLDGEFVIEVADAKQLRPEALAGGQRIDADGGTHVLELLAEGRILPDLVLVLGGKLFQLPSES